MNLGIGLPTLVPNHLPAGSSVTLQAENGILGAMQVSASGDLANWLVPGAMVKGMGGAMDLVSGARRVITLMEHRTRQGAPKLLETCTLPLTGRRVVQRVITDLAVLDITGGTFTVVELAPSVTVTELQEATAAPVTLT